MDPSRTPASHSLLHRVALGAVASALISALVAATGTSVFAAYLTQRANDQRVRDAALVLATEIEDELTEDNTLPEIIVNELRETRYTGTVFAIFDRDTRQRLAGDARVPASFEAACMHAPSLRACGVPASGTLWVVAANGHADVSVLFALASALAALLAGVGAWLASRPIARWLMGPLSELREQVGAIDFASAHKASLGPPAGVLEVDALRGAITELLERVQRALHQAERFAAEAAHELRTPLTMIRGELELLSEQSALPPEARTSLAGAQRRVLELGTLIERLLVLALPGESQWCATELISLHELAEDLIAALPAAERARIQLSEPRGNVLVRGDGALLRLLLSNGLANALKFGDHVSVALFEDGPDAVLRVDDDGPGVPLDQRTQAFEPFVRFTTPRTRGVAGHGLGLALIAHVARRHGGLARFVDGPPGAHLEIRLAHQHPKRVMDPDG